MKKHMQREDWTRLPEYIPDRQLFLAVQHALYLMREDGKAPGLANHIAARRYGVPVSSIAHHTGKVGARSAAGRSPRS